MNDILITSYQINYSYHKLLSEKRCRLDVCSNFSLLGYLLSALSHGHLPFRSVFHLVMNVVKT